ncbi:MAG: Na+/H+ antiporter subunit B [Thermoanaerobaculia bacterium]
MRSIILETVARFLTPLLVLFSIFLLLRGHHEPGGGFAGGLLASTAFALFMISSGKERSSEALPFDPRMLISGGLLVAVVAAVVGLFQGDAMLTGVWIAFPEGETPHYGTPLLFDVGVFLVVSGITILILQSLAEEE